MIIDVHGHLVPPDLVAQIRKEHGRFPSLRLIEEGGSIALAFAGGKPSRPIMKGLSDIAGRLAWMGKQGIDRQVNGSWPDWFGYELPAAEGEAWCRMFNEAQLAAAKAEPRFVPLAVVPMQDGARAAAVLKSAVAAGFPGAMISTLPRGIGSGLDAPDLHPFWAAADETGALIPLPPSSHPHPSELRRRRQPRERLWPRQRRRPHQRRHRRGGAAPLQRSRDTLPQRQDLCADGCCRLAVSARTAHPQRQDHARRRRPGGRF